MLKRSSSSKVSVTLLTSPFSFAPRQRSLSDTVRVTWLAVICVVLLMAARPSRVRQRLIHSEHRSIRTVRRGVRSREQCEEQTEVPITIQVSSHESTPVLSLGVKAAFLYGVDTRYQARASARRTFISAISSPLPFMRVGYVSSRFSTHRDTEARRDSYNGEVAGQVLSALLFALAKGTGMVPLLSILNVDDGFYVARALVMVQGAQAPPSLRAGPFAVTNIPSLSSHNSHVFALPARHGCCFSALIFVHADAYYAWCDHLLRANYCMIPRFAD